MQTFQKCIALVETNKETFSLSGNGKMIVLKNSVENVKTTLKTECNAIQRHRFFFQSIDLFSIVFRAFC